MDDNKEIKKEQAINAKLFKKCKCNIDVFI